MKKLLAITMAILLSGCCSLIGRGNDQQVSIYTSAGRADYVKVTNKRGMVLEEGSPETIVLSGSMKVKKGHFIPDGYFTPEKYVVELHKAGYETSYAEVNWHFSKWYLFGNLLTLGIGYIVDPLFGNIFYLDEEKEVYMQPTGGTVSFGGGY